VSAENIIAGGDPQEPTDPARERSVSRRVMLLAFLLAIAVRICIAWYSGAAQPQEIRYITIARGILSGQGYVGLDNRFPDIIQPPVFPLMLAAALALPGSDLALSRGVAILFGALLVFPGAAVARRLFGEKTARRLAVLIAVYPLLTHISSAAITESTFAVFVTAGALCLWRGLDPGAAGRARARDFLLAGVLFGLSFLTRPEGLTYLVVGCALILVTLSLRRVPWRVSARSFVLPMIGFGLFGLPYFIWVHAETGQWLIAPKAVLVQVHHSLVQEGQREQWKEPYGSLLFFEHVKFGLNSDATAIRSHQKFDAVSVGLSEGLLVSDEGHVSLSDPKMAVRMVTRNVMELYLETIKYGFVLPSILLMLAGVGLFSRPWAGEHGRNAFFVMTFFAGSFSFLLTHVQARFLYSAMPFALPWVAEGWRRTEVWARESLPGGEASWPTRRRLATALVGVVVVGLTVIHLVPSVRLTGGLWAEHRELGWWIKENAPAGTTVMAATPVVSFYAASRFEVLPYAEVDDVIRYARHKGVDYLVADRAEIPTFRPQLTRLLNPARPHPGLELVKSLHDRTSHAIFLYRVRPTATSAQ